jgi:mevalonate kinase
MPGINRFFYEKEKYWPSKFETISDLSTIRWLEDRLFMITLWPRPADFVVLENTNITADNVKFLSDAAEMAWDGLIRKDIKTFAKGFSASFDSQVRMFPKMMNDKIIKIIDNHRDKALAWKLSGAGGGGYLIIISEEEIPNAIKIKIRIKDYWI